MPIKKAAEKWLRHSKRRTVLNKRVKLGVKDAVKEARTLITKGDAKAEEAVKTAIKLLDRAVRQGSYKKNTVARIKSRLMSALHAIKK